MTSSNSSKRDGFAVELNEALERPIHNRTLGKAVGRGDLDYEVYLNTKALFGLQTESTKLSVPDEHLFQVMHQAQELWLKAVAFEAVSLVGALDAGRIHDACSTATRIVLVQRSLAEEMRILQTLTPRAFQTIRRNLGNGSGLESPGYNRVLLAAEGVELAFRRWIDAHGLSIVDIYMTEPRSETSAAFERLAELLVDWDEAFQTWLVAHFMLVRRTIGVHRQVKALDGFPTQALAPRMTKPLFPELWDARVELTKEWVRDGGHAPGDARPSGNGDGNGIVPSAVAPGEPL